MDLGIKDLRVVVTAGASGIGRAIAEGFLREGARVHVCDVDEKALSDLLVDPRSGEGPLSGSRCDVADRGQVARMFDDALSRLGGLDCLINNAGIAGPTGGVDEIAVEDWRRCIDIGLTGQFLCARRAVPLIKAAGGGSIVCMSSAAGRFGYAFRTPYSAAKWGIIGFTQSLAKELGPSAIRVNAILPGIIEGPRMESVIANRAKQVGVSHDEMKTRYLANVSLRRMTSPWDVAAMVAFLLSDAGINVSGQSLGVDGNVEAL